MKKKKILFDPADLTKVVKKIKVKGEKKFYSCPAIEFKVINKVGAGDAMLSMASICIKNKIHPLKILLDCSIAASKVVSGAGNYKSINKKYFLKSFSHFSK